MGSLSSKPDALYDPIRQAWVKDTPEERIRAHLLQHMIEELGFPPSLLAVEKELKSLPHLTLHQEKIPKRRADIIAFAKGIHPAHTLFPLLMIECKALPLTKKFLTQVVGYNATVQAPFLSVANENTLLTGAFCPQEKIFKFKEGLPSYSTLLESIGQ